MTTTSASHLRYESLTEDIIPTLLEIEHEAYPEPWTGGMFRDEMRNTHSYFYIAYMGDELIGYAGFWMLVDVAHVTSVTVAESHRGRGYGRVQMQHIIDEAIAEEAASMTLEVRESNASARAMYDNFGFREIGLRKGYYTKSKEDAIVMELVLKPAHGDDDSNE